MKNTFIAIAVILAMLSLWALVQHAARRFAKRHPEFGPASEEGGRCGISCGCKNWKACKEPKPSTKP